MRRLLKFEADWCGPCQQVKPAVNDVVAERENLELQSIDIDAEENLDLVRAYGVRAVPTFVLTSDDKVIAMTSGAMSRSQLAAFVDQAA